MRRRRRVLSSVSRSDSNFTTLLDGMEDDLSVGATVPSEAMGGTIRDSPQYDLVQINSTQRDSVQLLGATPAGVARSVRDSESDTDSSRHRPEDTQKVVFGVEITHRRSDSKCTRFECVSCAKGNAGASEGPKDPDWPRKQH